MGCSTEPACDTYIKDAIRLRDGYKCVDCGMSQFAHIDKYGKALDVHRVIAGAPYSQTELVTLCRSCHGKRHGPDKRRLDPTAALNVSIPGWLKDMLDKEAKRQGRTLASEVSRRLKVAFGLSPETEESPKDWSSDDIEAASRGEWSETAP